jgi:hypothetical protein
MKKLIRFISFLLKYFMVKIICNIRPELMDIIYNIVQIHTNN